MKSLPAVVALFIICATSGSNASGDGETASPYQQRPYSVDHNADQGSYGQAQAPRQRQSWLPKSEKFRPKVNVRLNLDIGAKLNIFRKSEESEDVYYRRIVAQRSYESNDEYFIRVEILKFLLPDLRIWKDNEYYNYWSLEQNSIAPNVKHTYLENIDGYHTDTDEQFYKRIFQKHEDEDVNEYIRRICVMRTAFPTLSVWERDGFVAYVKPNLLTPQNVKKSPGSPSSSSNAGIQISAAISNSPSPSQNSPIPSTNPTVPSSPKATTENVPPSGTNINNPTTPQQATPTTSTASTQNIVYLPGKQKKLKVGEYGRKEGETDEQYCKRILATDQPLKKKKLYKKIDHLKKVNKRFRKYVWKLCKPYVTKTKHSTVLQQESIVQQLPSTQTVPNVQLTSTAQQLPSTQTVPNVQLTSTAQQYTTTQTVPNGQLTSSTQGYPTTQTVPNGQLTSTKQDYPRTQEVTYTNEDPTIHNQAFNTQRPSNLNTQGPQLTAGAHFTADI